MSPETLRVLPALNAGLNATAAVLLGSGYALIRLGRRRAHAACMLAAVATSTLFLASYVTYHLHVGSQRYAGHGAVRAAYFGILLTHTVLAVVNLPLVGVTLVRALRGSFASHRAVARWTLPVWGYVSVTGVAIYLMLYGL